MKHDFIFQSQADRVLIYLTLYISECLKKLQRVMMEFFTMNIFRKLHDMENSESEITLEPYVMTTLLTQLPHYYSDFV